MKSQEMTKAKLISLLYEYKRLPRHPFAKVAFYGDLVNLYFDQGNNCHKGITIEKAYRILENRMICKRAGKGNGYIGRSMSINAQRAYQRGLKPVSKITSSDLKQNGFSYPVKFFRWLIRTWDVKPKEMHHTSAACNITPFYDASVIRYVAGCCDLERLFRIYKGNLTVGQAIEERGIRYARIRVLDKLIGGKSGKGVNANAVLCDGILFISSKLCFRAGDMRVEIMEIYDQLPEDMADGKLRETAKELVKHKLKLYRKYLKT